MAELLDESIKTLNKNKLKTEHINRGLRKEGMKEVLRNRLNRLCSSFEEQSTAIKNENEISL